jgi:ankyrin repeat protein
MSVSYTPKRKLYVTLHAAVQAQDEYALKRMLDNGVAPDVTDAQGRTALMLAIENNDLPCTRTLARGGAYLHRVDKDGLTPLELSKKCGHEVITGYLNMTLRQPWAQPHPPSDMPQPKAAPLDPALPKDITVQRPLKLKTPGR